MADQILQSVLPNNSIRPLINSHEVSTLYVDNESNCSQKEDSIPQNDIIMGFSSKEFGSTSYFRLSKSYQFLNQIFVRFTIDSSAAFNNGSDYLAYNLIKSVKYQVGATELLTIYQESMLDFLHEQCSCDDQKLLLHELAGYATIPNLDNKQMYVWAILPLPWSTLKSNKIKNGTKPFPLHALNDNIEIAIELNSLSAINVGPNGLAPVKAAMEQTNLKSAALQFRYSKIGNYQQMMKEKIRYPFKQVIAKQSKQFTVALGETPVVQSIDLQGFRKGEMSDILLHLSSGNDIFRGRQMNNINLLFNGTKIWNSNSSDRCWDLITGGSASTYGKKRIKVVAGVAGLTTQQDSRNVILNNTQEANNTWDTYGYTRENQAIDVAAPNGTGIDSRNYYYAIPIGEIRLKMLDSMNNYALGGDFSKQALTLTFETPINAGAAETYTLYASYVYTGVYEIDEFGSAILAF